MAEVQSLWKLSKVFHLEAEETNGTTPPPTALNSEPGLSSGSCMPAVEKNLPLGEPIWGNRIETIPNDSIW